jgi:hypothetical protein
MTLLPGGRSERSVIDDEMAAAGEFQRLTQLYLSKVRELYPKMSRPTKRRITPTLQQLRDIVGPSGWQR